MKYKNPISFLILFLLLSVTCFSQSIVNRANSSYTVQDARFSAQYNLFVPKYADTTAANLQVGIDSCSAIIYTYSTHTFWYRSCASSTKKWVEIGSGGGGSGITIGSTTITSGTNTRVLFNNSGVVGEYTISGTGSVAMTASPTFTGTVTIPTPFTLGAVSVLPTGTELNFVDGVTSSIQTQIDGKANTALSNIASTSIPTSLLFNANNSYDIGDVTNGLKDVYARTVKLDGSVSGTMTLQAASSVGTNTITFPAFTGTVLIGSQTAGRIPFAVNSATLTDDAGLTWDNGDKELLIGGGANVGAFPMQVYKVGNSAISIHNGTQFANLLAGSSLSIFQFPVANKFGIQAATSITDNGSSGVYPLIAFGSGNSHAVLIGGVAFSATPNARLDVRGSLATQYTATATSLTTDITHSTINVTATGQTITLPTAVGISGRIYTVKLTASGSGTVATTSSQTIDGSTTYSLSAQYKFVTVQSDNANWIIIGNN